MNQQNSIMSFLEKEKPKKYAYYQEKFEKIGVGKKATWNWSAFLFGSFWMFYRRMPVLAHITNIVLLAGFFFIGLPLLFLQVTVFDKIVAQSSNYKFLLSNVTSFIVLLSYILIHVLYGLYGNYLYRESLSWKFRNNYPFDEKSTDKWVVILFMIFFPAAYIYLATRRIARRVKTKAS